MQEEVLTFHVFGYFVFKLIINNIREITNVNNFKGLYLGKKKGIALSSSDNI
jgi:hypothetical protein